ncbi:MAG: AMP-binding protein [Bdellovibrionales bacterium]|nr:AMP-binding protein [Bdellovibrionales bacterium]
MRFEQWLSKIQLHQVKQNRLETWKKSDLQNIYQQLSKILIECKEGSLIYLALKDQRLLLLSILVCLDCNLHPIPEYEYSIDSDKDFIKNHLNPAYFLHYKNKRFVKSESKSGKIQWNAEPGIIFQTSGSSGIPKFVHQPLSHLLYNAQVAAERQAMDELTRALIPLTLSHTGGLNMQTLPALYSGGSIEFVDKRAPSQMHKRLFSGSITHAVLVPNHLRQALSAKKWLQEDFVNNLKVLTGSCPVDYHLFSEVNKRGGKLLSVYGLTEIGPFLSCQDKGIPPKKGQAVLGQFQKAYKYRIGSDQQIEVMGPTAGSYLSLVENNYIVTSCGEPWVKTGDLGIEVNGQLEFFGRINRQINFAGFKFYPEEVEACLLLLPEVHFCRVYGLADPVYNQLPAVDIVGDFKEVSVLKNHLKKHLHPLKVPKVWNIVEQIGLTSIDKVSGNF